MVIRLIMTIGKHQLHIHQLQMMVRSSCLGLHNFMERNKYNADNTKGWEAIKSNDTSETPTKYDWNGTAWVSE